MKELLSGETFRMYFLEKLPPLLKKRRIAGSEGGLINLLGFEVFAELHRGAKVGRLEV